MKAEGSPIGVAGIARWTVGLCLTIGSLLLLAQLPPTPAGEAWYASSAFFPVAAIVLVVMGALTHLWQTRHAPPDASEKASDATEDEIDASGTDPRLAVIAIVGLVIYQGLIVLLGFGLATLLFVVAGARLCSLSVRHSLVVGLVLSLVLYGVFVSLFKVGLPDPLLLQWVTGS
jgi:hypothetical protein